MRIFILLVLLFFFGSNSLQSAENNPDTSPSISHFLLAAVVLAAAILAMNFWRRATISLQHSLPLAWWRSAARRAGVFFLGGGAALILVDIFVPNEFLPADKFFNFYLPFLCTVAAIFSYDTAPNVSDFCRQWMQRNKIRPDQTLLALLLRVLRLGIVLLYVIYLYWICFHSSFTTLLASLGIGGMAFAFAATDTLKNFIAFLIILIDKPFVVGDRVLLAGNDGIVEDIGLRTLRLRLFADNHLLSLPNTMATDSAVRNISARHFFHRGDTLRLHLNNSPEQVKIALEILREILHAHAGLRQDYPPQITLSGITATAFEIIFDYWFFNSSADAFAAFNEKVNLQIINRFATAGILLSGQSGGK